MLADSLSFAETATTFPEDALIPPGSTAPTVEGLTDETQIFRAYIPGSEKAGVQVSFSHREVPNSVVELIPEIVGLLDLEPNWDSYGALAINPRAAANAIGMILSLMKNDTPTPSVVPTSRGGIQFQWEIGSRYLEVEVFHTDRIEAYYSDSADPNSEIEGDFTSRMNELRRYVEALTSV